MLGDCYAAAIVEHLSKDQLVAAGAATHQVRIKLILHTVTNLYLHILNLYIYFYSIKICYKQTLKQSG